MSRRQQFHQGSLVSHMTPMDAGYVDTLHGMASNLVAKGASAADAATQAQGLLYAVVQRHASMMAVTDTFWILSLVFLAVIPIALLLKSAPRMAGPVPMD
jgi:DHA2 family multidrug resistance protein